MYIVDETWAVYVVQWPMTTNMNSKKKNNVVQVGSLVIITKSWKVEKDWFTNNKSYDDKY